MASQIGIASQKYTIGPGWNEDEYDARTTRRTSSTKKKEEENNQITQIFLSLVSFQNTRGAEGTPILGQRKLQKYVRWGVETRRSTKD